MILTSCLFNGLGLRVVVTTNQSGPTYDHMFRLIGYWRLKESLQMSDADTVPVPRWKVWTEPQSRVPGKPTPNDCVIYSPSYSDTVSLEIIVKLHSKTGTYLPEIVFVPCLFTLSCTSGMLRVSLFSLLWLGSICHFYVTNSNMLTL